jgi:integrase
LEVPRIFRWQVLEEFIHRGMTGYLSGSRATHRSTLTLVVEVLNPADVRQHHRPIPRSKPTEPYTVAEVAALYSWATSQGTVRRRKDALAILALGLGAGLATREILGVKAGDIESSANRLLVMVWEGRPRVVPILDAWQPMMRRVLNDADPESWLFRPGRATATSGQITDFLLRARTDLDVRPARMRTTWLLEHLAIGTAPKELLRISGLKNLAALDKITQFAPRMGDKLEQPVVNNSQLTRHLSADL